jgi:hypothetical protein
MQVELTADAGQLVASVGGEAGLRLAFYHPAVSWSSTRPAHLRTATPTSSATPTRRLPGYV